jgi:glycosyltransferase involved in cell wall biosynthesis
VIRGDATVSIVIPTRDGGDTLPTTLRSVTEQSYPHDLLEVIVVDDGSADGPLDADAALSGPVLTCIRQEQAGAASARNTGAGRATGSLLVFLDDDVEMLPGAVRALANTHRTFPGAIVVGQLRSPPPSNAFERLEVIRPTAVARDEVTAIDFTECYTGLLSVAAADFAACEGFRDPTGGWPSWDDIDFSYRAQRLGIRLLRCRSAQAVHHDRSSADLGSLCHRWHAASISAVRLFQCYPGIQPAFPMYRDKLPVSWRYDSLPIVVRKLLRSTVSCAPANWWIRHAAESMASRGRLPSLVRPLCGLAISGSMWRGLREGVGRHGPLPHGTDGTD